MAGQSGAGFGLHLDWRWSPADGGLPADMRRVVTTYQQVASCASGRRVG